MQHPGSLKQSASHTHLLTGKKKEWIATWVWVVGSTEFCLEALVILMNTIPSLVSFVKVQGKGRSLNFTTYPFLLEI